MLEPLECQRRNKLVAKLIDNHDSKAMLVSKKIMKRYSNAEIALGVVGPLVVTAACSYIKLPPPEIKLTLIESFWYTNHVTIISIMAILIFLFMVWQKTRYANAYELFKDAENRQEENQSDRIKDLISMNTFLTMLCHKISEGEKSLRTMCNMMCASIHERLTSESDICISINIYEYNDRTKLLWMPGHFDNRKSNKQKKNPKLYTEEQSKVLITDDSIKFRYLSKCITRELETVNILYTNADIRREFEFQNISEGEKKRYTQYLNCVYPDLDDYTRFMVEIVSFNGTMIANKQDLHKLAENTLGSFGDSFPDMKTLSQLSPKI